MEIVELLAALACHWRVGLATTLTIVAAVALARSADWFTGGYGIAMVLVGLGIGLLWEGDAAKPKAESQAGARSNLSSPVLALALWFFGAIVGSLTIAITGSRVAAAALLFFGILTVYVYLLRVGQQRMTPRKFVLSAASLLLGLGTVLAAGMALAQQSPNLAFEPTAQSWPRQARLLFSSQRGQLWSAAQRTR